MAALRAGPLSARESTKLTDSLGTAALSGRERLHGPRFKDDQSHGDHDEIVSKRMGEWTPERTTFRSVSADEQGFPSCSAYFRARTATTLRKLRQYIPRHPAKCTHLPGRWSWRPPR